MKLKRFVKAIAAGLAGLGLLLPVDAVEAAVRPKTQSLSAKELKAGVINVKLSDGGVLRGRVSDGKKGLAPAAVSIRQGEKEIAKKMTSSDGTFQFKGLKPGVYQVLTLYGQKERLAGRAIYRLWTKKAAPPNAIDTAQLIPGKTIIRAQGGDNGDQLFDENGNPVVRVRIVDNPGLAPLGPGAMELGSASLIDAISFYDIFTLGLLTTATIFTIKNYLKNKDIEDKVDALKSP